MSDIAWWQEPAWKAKRDAYQARCACSWRGNVRREWRDARDDLNDHLGEPPYQFAACTPLKRYSASEGHADWCFEAEDHEGFCLDVLLDRLKLEA